MAQIGTDGWARSDLKSQWQLYPTRILLYRTHDADVDSGKVDVGNEWVMS